MTEYRIWPATNGPTGSFNDGQPISQGTQFKVSAEGWVTKLWYYRADISMGDDVRPTVGQIFLVTGPTTGTPIANTNSFVTPSNVPVGSWQSVVLFPAVHVLPGNTYKAVVFFPDGAYTASAGGHYWDTTGAGANGITNGILTALPASQAIGGQATYDYSTTGIIYPTSSFNSGNYWIDVSVSDTNPNTNAGAFLGFLG